LRNVPVHSSKDVDWFQRCLSYHQVKHKTVDGMETVFGVLIQDIAKFEDCKSSNCSTFMPDEYYLL